MQIQRTTWDQSRETLSAIRQAVFVIEQNVPVELELDAYDERAQHVVARNKAGVAMGTGRLLPDGSIGRMAVLKAHRGRGVGRAMLDELMAWAAELGFAQAQLGAQLHAIPFYERAGFRAFGPVYDDAGIAHRKMRTRLPARPQTTSETP